MLLAVDVGNTQTHLGLWQGDELAHTWRIATRPLRTTDDLAVQLDGLLALRDVDVGVISALVVSSTVPVLAAAWSGVGESALEVDTLLMGPGVRSGMPILMDNPREVGPDRIVNSVAALARVGGPCIAVDFGTSTNFDAVSAGGEYVGGVLAPGVAISMDALFDRAARLTRIEFVEPPSVIGRNTVHALQSGVVYGFAGMVDGIVRRMSAELGGTPRVLATGGLAGLIAPHAETVHEHVPDLTLEGLRLVYERQRAQPAE
jgi:type III pantothenate kinase